MLEQQNYVALDGKVYPKDMQDLKEIMSDEIDLQVEPTIENLRKIREAYGVEVYEVVDIMGISQRIYQCYENGDKKYKEEKKEIDFVREAIYAMDEVVRRREYLGIHEEYYTVTRKVTIEGQLKTIKIEEKHDVYRPLTDRLKKTIYEQVKNGGNLLKICMHYAVNDGLMEEYIRQEDLRLQN